MQTLKEYALSFVGTPYKYGGDDPVGGFDCSGLVSEILVSAGVLRHGQGKLNSQMIFDALQTNSSPDIWGLGSVAFFGKDAKSIVHIGWCLDQYRMIEAGGGTSDTLTDNDAIARNAFVKIRLIKYRKDFLCVVKPRYASIGVSW